ncbi:MULTISPECIES: 30S ribosomal protein S16 [unclassified Candidatus Frackibacter]|uniref:30S ribosomal protein S16 n=1 Tax=unclassified Candidatus Frackibacter TaxID=2648818 RepID=UPI0007998D78|nr:MULTISPECIES: 30S ribosomal protein S16 [unclassified Candidatus Frackibacter]KXS45478.1 MAG: ribosomal protein S16 [Candidatus Frackibacter sp. T328-2]SDC00939.1 SSU ribosomal protein S16P [Candidatus Frackibacter sp. WG11]SEM32282.1 SSU ribosomal protein S16P [Candidatus Frackibacter sp. WG12]SFL37206.1 SSU ribosomal protein S16P [Candidatus Frackibacter sp. WG13]
MAVKIRLKRMGAKRNPSYRLVVADSRKPRDGRFIEELGYYNPTTEPKTVKIDEERALEWLQNGAKPSDTIKTLFKREGIMKKFDELKR